MNGGAALPAGFGFAETPRKPLPPLQAGQWALTQAAVDKWIDGARAGDELVYARGLRVVQSDGVRRLRELHDAGAIAFTSRRIGPEDTAFIAQRLSGGSRPAPAQRLARPPRADEDADEVAQLMAALRRLAAERKPCPTNRELGQMIGGVGPERVSYLLRKQIGASRIRVDALATGRRVVTIVATGRRTSDA